MPHDLWEQAKASSDAEERTVAQTIRLALKRYLRAPTQGPEAVPNEDGTAVQHSTEEPR